MTYSKIIATEIPSWICNKELSSINESNDSANSLPCPISNLDPGIKIEIKESLVSNGVCYHTENNNLIFISLPEAVLVQDHNRRDTDIQQKANKSGELNKILRTEIDDHKRTQEKLKDHSERLNAIFDSSALYIWTLNSGMELSSCNAIFKDQMSSWFERKMEIGSKMIEDPYEENEEAWKHFTNKISESLAGNSQNFELFLKTKDGEYVWVEVYMDPIVHVEDGSIDEISCIGFQVTERKLASQNIDESLKEKETLLQEVHHRVKNNLQIISSLINLQSSYIKEEKMLNILKESQNRIRSMSVIHESLYMNKNFTSIDLRDYVHGLTSNLIQSYSLNPSKVEMELDVDPVHISLDQAVPCGLILNELVSNSLKHAYEQDEKGRLVVSIKEKDGRMAIMISDDGKGVPEDWSPENNESLGIQLVYTLTEQLDGEIEYSREKGSKYLITFDRVKTSRKWQ